MKKSWGLTDKILSREKKIESRWYFVRRAPWDKIKKGDVVYFKNAGERVKIRASVSRVMQFANLTEERVKWILEKYGKDDGIGEERIPEFFKRFRDKKYCMLIFLKNPVAIKPFRIDKTGFGAMSAWITVASVSKIR